MPLRHSQHSQPQAAIEDREDEIEALFDQADDDGDREIDFLEFKSMMRDLDPEMTQSSLDIGFREIDIDHDGRINFAEFRDWWNCN